MCPLFVGKMSAKKHGDHKVHLKIYTLATLITFFATSCAFVPKISDEQKQTENCNMFTKNLTLSATKIEDQVCIDAKGNKDLEACLILFGVIVPAGSFVISGSIVLVGKTLHWLEYQGTCEEGIIARALDKQRENI